ncbi:hypothetical protein F5883DRAFT_543685, partial [Diaporthe sp. PMI_573]
SRILGLLSGLHVNVFVPSISLALPPCLSFRTSPVLTSHSPIVLTVLNEQSLTELAMGPPETIVYVLKVSFL